MATGVEELGARELETLQLMAQGYSNIEIADIQTVSIHTVKARIDQMKDKLGVRSVRELIAVSVRNGWA